MLLLDGPSGVGKSTLLAYIRERWRNEVEVGMKYTTRPRRSGDNEWEFRFVETIPESAAEHAFQSVAHWYAIDIAAAARAQADGRIYCVTCTDQATLAKLRQTVQAICVYVARPMSEAAVEGLLSARGIASTSDAEARREEHRQAGSDYLAKLGLIDHVILNDAGTAHLFAQIDAIIAMHAAPPKNGR